MLLIRVSLLIDVAKPDDQRFDPAYLHQEETVTEWWLFSFCIESIW